jgi:hypothetical protein
LSSSNPDRTNHICISYVMCPADRAWPPPLIEGRSKRGWPSFFSAYFLNLQSRPRKAASLSYLKFQPGAVVTVSDYAGLRAARKSFGRFACEFLVKGFVVVEPLTDSEFRKLPLYLQNIVER